MTRPRKVHTDRAPAAIGPYAQALVQAGWIFTSGQIALDPATGRLVEGPADRQAERVLDHLAAVLEAAGGGLDTVVRTTVYLTDLANFPAVNAVYAERFGDHRPARSTVQVVALPAGADVEIDAIARVRRLDPE